MSLSSKHEAVLRKAAVAVRDRGHEGDARLADSVLGIAASLSVSASAGAAASTTPTEFYAKAYICKACGAVYVDDPVTQCDCMPVKQEFDNGVVLKCSA